MDRLSLFKVLADGSRYAIYQEMAEAGVAMSTTEIADRLDLHPNTVRLHLEKMRDVGLLEVAHDRHGSVGRPQHLWSVVSDAPSLGLEPAGYRLLAHLLADLAARTPIDSDAVADVGRRRGRSPGPTGSVGSSGGSGAVGPAEVVGRVDAGACLRSVMDELADLGFDPTIDTAGPGEDSTVVASIAFSRCPFRELAALYPDLVCQLHLGITEGIVARASLGAGVGDTRVRSFSSLVDEDPCRVELSISG